MWQLDGQLIHRHLISASSSNKIFLLPDGKSIAAVDDYRAKLRIHYNLFGAWRSGSLWDQVYKLSSEEQAAYGIDWEY